MKTNALALGALAGAILIASAIAHGDPIPSFTRAQVPLVKVNASTVGIRASSSAQSGFMSAAQASDLAFVLGGGLPTPTPVSLDPLNLTYGRLESEGLSATYLADTFTSANVADIAGRSLPIGGTTWGKWQSSTRTIGIVSNAAAFTGGAGNVVYSAASQSSTTGAVVVSFNYAITSGQSGLFVRANGSDCSGYSIDFNGGSQIHIVQRDSACGVVAQSTDDSGGAYINAVGTMTVTLDGSTISASWSQGGTASIADVYPTRTRMGLWGTGGTIANYAFTNFSFATPSVPPGISLRGTYGTGYATETIGGTLGGFDFAFPANTGNNTFHQAVVLGSSLSVAGASAMHAVSASGQITSTVAGGTPAFVLGSSTKCTNLNADLLDGLDSTAFALAGTSPTKACAASLSLSWGTVATLDTVRFTGQTCTGVVNGDECSVSVDSALPAGAVLFAQGDGSNTVLVEAGCIKSTGCTFAAQNTRVICVHH